MRYHLPFAGLLLTVLVAGCSPSAEDAAATRQSDAPQHVWRDQVKALDSAREVEQTLRDAQSRREQPGNDP
jgi:hypothetical protein